MSETGASILLFDGGTAARWNARITTLEYAGRKKVTRHLYKVQCATQKACRKYVTCIRKSRLRNRVWTRYIHVEFYEFGPMALLLQGEPFWLLSIPEKPKPSGTVIGSVSAIRSYFSRTDFFSYFPRRSGAYESHNQREITRYNELRNKDQGSK